MSVVVKLRPQESGGRMCVRSCADIAIDAARRCADGRLSPAATELLIARLTIALSHCLLREEMAALFEPTHLLVVALRQWAREEDPGKNATWLKVVVALADLVQATLTDAGRS